MILLTGVTGKTGQHVLDCFIASKIPIRVFVRDTQRLHSEALRDSQIVIGDMGDIESVRRACNGIETAFLLMSNTRKQAQIEKTFIDVAINSGVSRIVNLSASGADIHSSVELDRIHGEVEEHLKQSGLHFTIIRPNYFMQNLLHSADTISNEGRVFLPFGSAKTGMIDVRDVASFIFHVITEPGHIGQTYELTGPELLSFQDAASLLMKVLGKPIVYVDEPIEQFRSRLLNWDSDEWFVDTVSEMFKELAKGSDAKLTKTFEQITGAPPRRFIEFAIDHKSVFLS